MSTKWDNDEVIQRFRQYLMIPSVHPNIDYSDCVNFLEKEANLLDLPMAVHEPVPNKPVVIITWQGLEPELPSILLNSHMDVVPVYEDHWTHPPFDAVITEDGFIHARGTQDMKGIGMMHLEAVRKLKDAGVRLKRTIHVSFVPDEEIGGLDGMGAFSETEEFKDLNIGFALDESVPTIEPKTIIAFNGERTSRAVRITCRGETCHGAKLSSNTAGEKIQYVIDEFMAFRAQEMKKVNKDGTNLGDVTTINLTQLSGGVQINVVPESLTVSFDIRLAPNVDPDEFENMIMRWCTEAGDGVSFEYAVKNPQVKSTVLEGNAFWTAMNKAVSEMGYRIMCVTCPGATDARYVRRKGIPVINFSPMTNCEMLLHAHNETIHVDVFMKGIEITKKVVEAIANV